MKIRNGFVSNSSSSSFIIAFPNRPKTFEDIRKYIFGDIEGNDLYQDSDISYNEISKHIFITIKKASKKEIISNLAPRLYYSPSFGSYFRINKYCGSDQKLVDNLVSLFTKRQQEEDILSGKEKQFINNAIPPVKYASKGINSDDKSIKKYNNYIRRCENFIKDNKELDEMKRDMVKIYRDNWEKIRELQNKISKKDAEAFINDNKDSFIALASFSNDYDLGSVIEYENGYIFNRLPYIAINHH
jgi:hypothetical protein